MGAPFFLWSWLSLDSLPLAYLPATFLLLLGFHCAFLPSWHNILMVDYILGVLSRCWANYFPSVVPSHLSLQLRHIAEEASFLYISACILWGIRLLLDWANRCGENLGSVRLVLMVHQEGRGVLRYLTSKCRSSGCWLLWLHWVDHLFGAHVKATLT